MADYSPTNYPPQTALTGMPGASQGSIRVMVKTPYMNPSSPFIRTPIYLPSKEFRPWLIRAPAPLSARSPPGGSPSSAVRVGPHLAKGQAPKVEAGNQICMCIYIYVYMYKEITHTNIHTYMHAYMHTYAYTYVQICIPVRTFVCLEHGFTGLSPC